MIGVRIREGGFEGQCDYCREYWPLAPDFWPIRSGGLRRCRACLRAYKALKQLGYVASRRALYNAATRERLALLPPAEQERRRASKRAWRAAHKEHVAAYNRAYRQRRRAA